MDSLRQNFADRLRVNQAISTCKLLLLMLPGLILPAVFAEEKPVSVPVDPALVINQKLYRESVNACAPAALCNALRFGDPERQKIFQSLRGKTDADKLRYLVDRYFRTRRSGVAKERFRWGFHGVYTADLALSCNEILQDAGLEPCQAGFLDRDKGESDAGQIERIHSRMKESLQRGFPPILSLRSFMVKSRKERQWQPGWEKVFHHFVVVHSIDSHFDAAGFTVGIIDSNGGKLSKIHIHPEPNHQPFNVLKGNDVEGEWLPGREFLLVTAPGVHALRPANLQWSERFIITANYLVGRY